MKEAESNKRMQRFVKGDS